MFPPSQKKIGFGRPNCGARHASSLQRRRLLHRERWPSHNQGTERRLIIHPRLERGKIVHVRQRSQNRDKHQVVSQENRPRKPPTASQNAIKGSRNRTSGLQFETSRPSMRSMPARKTTSTTIPGGELHKKGPP